uniref:Uncharacterized protein n=1 Tax=Anguilla anguilla TaxID=7936 RepID=A0A0E9SB08_ANGAN
MHLVFMYLMGKAHRCSPHQSKVCHIHPGNLPVSLMDVST